MKQVIRLLSSILLIVGLFSCNQVLEITDTRVIDAKFNIEDVEEGDSSILAINLTEGDDSCDYFVSWASGTYRDSIVVPIKVKETYSLPLDKFPAGTHEVKGELRRADGGANVVPISTEAVVSKKTFKAVIGVEDHEEGEVSVLTLKLISGDAAQYVLSYSVNGGDTKKVTLDLVKTELHEIEVGELSAGEHAIEAELSRKDGLGTPIKLDCSWDISPKVFEFSLSINDVQEGEESVASLVLVSGEKTTYEIEFLIDKKNALTHEALLGIGESCDIKLPVQSSGVHSVEAKINRKDGLGTQFCISKNFGVDVKSFNVSLSVADTDENVSSKASFILSEGDEVEYTFEVFIDEIKATTASSTLVKGEVFEVELPVKAVGKHMVSAIITRTDGLGTALTLNAGYEVFQKSFSFDAAIADVSEGVKPEVKINLLEGDSGTYSYVISVDKEKACEDQAEFSVGSSISVILPQAYASGYHEFIVSLSRTDGLGKSLEVSGSFNVSEKAFSVTASVATVTEGYNSVLSLTLKEGESTSYDVTYVIDKGIQNSTSVSMTCGSAANISLGRLSAGNHTVSGTVKRTDNLGSEKTFSASFTVDPDLSPDEVILSKNNFSVSMNESTTVSVSIAPDNANQEFTVTRTDSGSAKVTYSISGKTITIKGGATGGSVKLKVASKEDPDIFEYLKFNVRHRLALVLDVKCVANNGPWMLVPESASMRFVTWTGEINPDDPTMSGVTLYDFTSSFSYKANVYIHANPTSMESYSLKGDQPNFTWDTDTDWTYNGTTQSGRQWCLWKNRIFLTSNITKSPLKAETISSKTNKEMALSSLVNPTTDSQKTVDQGYLIYNNNYRKWYDGFTTWSHQANSAGKEGRDCWNSFYLTVSDIDIDWDDVDVLYVIHMYRTKPNGNWYQGGYWWQPVDEGKWAVPVVESDKK